MNMIQPKSKKIISEKYFTAGDACGEIRGESLPDNLMVCESLDRIMFCVIVLDDGSVMAGQSFLSGKVYDEDLSRRMARESAMNSHSNAYAVSELEGV